MTTNATNVYDNDYITFGNGNDMIGTIDSTASTGTATVTVNPYLTWDDSDQYRLYIDNASGVVQEIKPKPQHEKTLQDVVNEEIERIKKCL